MTFFCIELVSPEGEMCRHYKHVHSEPTAQAEAEGYVGWCMDCGQGGPDIDWEHAYRPGFECGACGGAGLILVRTGNAYKYFDQGDYDMAPCAPCGGAGYHDSTEES